MKRYLHPLLEDDGTADDIERGVHPITALSSKRESLCDVQDGVRFSIEATSDEDASKLKNENPTSNLTLEPQALNKPLHQSASQPLMPIQATSKFSVTPVDASNAPLKTTAQIKRKHSFSELDCFDKSVPIQVGSRFLVSPAPSEGEKPDINIGNQFRKTSCFTLGSYDSKPSLNPK
ncbi:hypothetical protein Ciccas_004039 [Cichlidogyrus casuarinus]|uniref:Uncharacterized protein n=1 Tax=Cichlidogyrus casuarinus TaxID=1844966 RepID=A0ABD2QD46_9PLAT